MWACPVKHVGVPGLGPCIRALHVMAIRSVWALTPANTDRPRSLAAILIAGARARPVRKWSRRHSVGDGGSEAVERPSQNPRHVHLGDPDTLADLLMCELVPETQEDDPPLGGREQVQKICELVLILDALVSRFRDVGERESLVGLKR